MDGRTKKQMEKRKDGGMLNVSISLFNEVEGVKNLRSMFALPQGQALSLAITDFFKKQILLASHRTYISLLSVSSSNNLSVLQIQS